MTSCSTLRSARTCFASSAHVIRLPIVWPSASLTRLSKRKRKRKRLHQLRPQKSRRLLKLQSILLHFSRRQKKLEKIRKRKRVRAKFLLKQRQQRLPLLQQHLPKLLSLRHPLRRKKSETRVTANRCCATANCFAR